MPRADETQWWYNAVYELVQRIPPGKVTTYGHVASLLGHPKRARQVGIALKNLPANPDLLFHHDSVPWQRVINSKAMISHRGPGAAESQAIKLRHEGVLVDEDAMGEFYINLDCYGWFPNQYPDNAEEITADIGDNQALGRHIDGLPASALQSSPQSARRRTSSLIRLRIKGRPAVSDITVQRQIRDDSGH